MAEEQANHEFDYVLIDLPPSFGALVRAAFYSADYFIVPCTSDNFNVYCVGLIGQMVPDFVRDWNTGYERFKQFNRYYEDFDNLGRPVFAGWVFNGFNTARQRRSKAEQNAGIAPKERQIVQADRAFLTRLSEVVIKDLVAPMESLNYNGVASNIPKDYLIGDIEDANVLIQNSLWQSVPLGQLESVRPFTEFQHRTGWSHDQADLINILREKFVELSQNIETICV
jgi:chromosome partitioning protein